MLVRVECPLFVRQFADVARLLKRLVAKKHTQLSGEALQKQKN
jgi:hypothetical protein